MWDERTRAFPAQTFFGHILFCCLGLFWPLPIRAQQPPLSEAERLFTERDRGDALRQAASLLEHWLKKDSFSYQVLWRLSKYKYYLGDRESQEPIKLRLFEEAIEFGKRAVKSENRQPDGHFWLAVGYGSYAELKGVFRSLWLLRTIRAEFDTVFKMDPNYENGAVYLALAEMDLRLPWLFGGNDRRGVARLETGLKVGPQNSELTRILGETYVRIGRKKEGRQLLEKVMTLEDPSRSAKEIAEIRNRAQQRIESMR